MATLHDSAGRTLSDGTEFPLGTISARYIFLSDIQSGSKEIQASDVRAFPNPALGSVTIEVPEILVGEQYTVYSIAGVPLQSGHIRSIQTLEDLPAGVHSLVIRHSSGPIIRRIVIFNP